MKRNVLAAVFLAVILAGCGRQADAGGDSEADAGGGGFLRKNAGERMAEADDSFGSERIYADGGRITYCAIVTNGC